MNQLFAPGCALYIHKPELAEKIMLHLNKKVETKLYLTCCWNEPPKATEKPAKVITVCSGCDKRYSTKHEGMESFILWQLLSESEDFPFPDYKGAKITVHDACPARGKPEIHNAVRALLTKMNFTIVEAEKSRENSVCCGSGFYGKVGNDEILELMKKRADLMPVNDVAVYCVSCIKSLANGGKTPRYIVDLLFGEKTEPGETDPDKWHKQIIDFSETH